MGFIAVLWVLVSIVLILVILVQKGRGGGLSAAFGGGMGGGLLGSKTGDFLTWVTIVLVAVFLTLAVLMARFYKPSPSTDFDAAPPPETQQPITAEPNALASTSTGEETTPEASMPTTEVNVPAPSLGGNTDANVPG